MIFRCAVSVLITISAIAACGDPPTTTVNKDYLPVAVGNRWVYNEIDVLGVRAEQTDTKEITGVEDFKGDSTFVMISTQSLTPTVKRFNWLVTADRVTRVRAEDSINGTVIEYHEYGPPVGFLRYSKKLTSVGDSIKEKPNHVICDPLTNTCVPANTIPKEFIWTIEAVDEVITVPAGTFSCIKIRRTRAAGNFKEYWYAEGVGKVYETGLANIEELLEYTIVE